jgi:hypothetical protein
MKTGAMSHAKGEGVILILFNTGHALPLVGTRILRPRIDRGLDAEYPPEKVARRPRRQSVRGPSAAMQCARFHPIVEIGYSLVVVNPRSPQCLRTVRALATSLSWLGIGQALSQTVIHIIHGHEPSMTVVPREARTGSVHELSHDQSWRRLSIGFGTPVRFPVHIQPIF